MTHDTIPFRWTPERIARMRELLDKGFAFGLIAKELGCSRNSAIGKAHRLGVRTGRYPPITAPKRPPTRQEPSEPPLTGIFSLRPISPRRLVKPPPAAPAGVPAGILDVTGCRYAVGEDAKVAGRHLFCNAATGPDTSWCKHHAAIVTTPAWGKFALKRMGAP